MTTKDETPDLASLRIAIVNVFLYGRPDAGDRGWTLVDTGVSTPGAAARIIRAASERYGPNARPGAIVLTHGHFDHVGSAKRLAEHWDVPVYAHTLELPYLTGYRSYPPPDPAAGEGAMSWLSPLYPRGPFDLGDRVRPFAQDSSLPGMPGWRWIHTPGHSPGHVSLYREDDRTLIAGDAFVTTKEESGMGVMRWEPEVHRPPAYFTPDWVTAGASVRRLAALEPELVVTGHGPSMRGAELRRELHALADDFDRVAVPRHGRYVEGPTARRPLSPVLLGAGAALVAGFLLRRRRG
jgi:glyoxylase-like metal-dependent hydrolase (beta-lactamase superfamily II)